MYTKGDLRNDVEAIITKAIDANKMDPEIVYECMQEAYTIALKKFNMKQSAAQKRTRIEAAVTAMVDAMIEFNDATGVQSKDTVTDRQREIMRDILAIPNDESAFSNLQEVASKKLVDTLDKWMRDLK